MPAAYSNRPLRLVRVPQGGGSSRRQGAASAAEPATEQPTSQTGRALGGTWLAVLEASPQPEPNMADNSETQDHTTRDGDPPRQIPQPVQAADSEIARQVKGGLPATDSLGSRAGSSSGSQTDRTGMADGVSQGSSQGLAGAQGSGGGADQAAGQPRREPPDAA